MMLVMMIESVHCAFNLEYSFLKSVSNQKLKMSLALPWIDPGRPTYNPIKLSMPTSLSSQFLQNPYKPIGLAKLTQLIQIVSTIKIASTYKSSAQRWFKWRGGPGVPALPPRLHPPPPPPRPPHHHPRALPWTVLCPSPWQVSLPACQLTHNISNMGTGSIGIWAPCYGDWDQHCASRRGSGRSFFVLFIGLIGSALTEGVLKEIVKSNKRFSCVFICLHFWALQYYCDIWPCQL